MNRGLMFYMPTVSEWSTFKTKILNRHDNASSEQDSNDHSPSGVYMLTNYMPALVVHLTRPNLTWCVDVDLLDRHETKINVGSSYIVADKCIFGPTLHYSDVRLVPQVSAHIDGFAKDVSNGLRWIFQIYRTTNILERHDLFNADLSVARNIRNIPAFENYTPVKLLTELRDTSDCEEVQMCASNDRQIFIQPFGQTGNTASNTAVRQMTRPHIGTALFHGFCSSKPDDIAIRDTYVVNAEDAMRLNELIAKNREEMTNRYYTSIFRPSSQSVHQSTIHTTNACGRNRSVAGERDTNTTGDNSGSAMETQPIDVTADIGASGGGSVPLSPSTFSQPQPLYPEFRHDTEAVLTSEVDMQMLDRERSIMDAFVNP